MRDRRLNRFPPGRRRDVNKLNALTEAISLTDEILLLLDQEDFEAVGELDAKRLPLIEQAF